MGRTSDIYIINLLRQKISSGGFDKTTFLPSERKLAEEYQVGRGIIRGALKVLSEERLIYKVPKRGFRIKKRTGKRLKRIIVRMPTPVSSKAYEAMGLVAGLCAGANEIYAEVILSTPPSLLNLSELQERYNSGDFQGIIFLESSPDIPLEKIRNAGIPFVIANLEEDKNFPGVRMDYRGIGELAGQELLQRNYKKIAVFSGPPERFLYKEILAGFQNALTETKSSFQNKMHIIGDWRETPQSLRELLMLPHGKRPDAIFTVRDYRAAQVFAICEDLSIRIPEELGVISFDGVSWPGAEKEGLISISEEVAEIGRQAIFLLQKQFESGYTPEIRMINAKISEGKSLPEKILP